MPQLSFDPLDYDNADAAKQARNVKYRELKSNGYLVTRWVLHNQLDERDTGKIRDVYMLNYMANCNAAILMTE